MTWAEINIPNPPANVDPDLYGWLTQLVVHLRTYLGAYHDRGSISSPDFTASDFTADSTWRDLDLSGIVDEDAKAVYFNVTGNSTVVDTLLAFRKNGYTNTDDQSGFRTQVASQRWVAYFLVPLDENRVIEYYADSTGTWNGINVRIKGWFK